MRILFLALLLVASGAAIAEREAAPMQFDPPLFQSVELGSYEPSACSPPDPGPEWRGVTIRVPQRVVVARSEVPQLPVCGYYLVDLAELPAEAALTLEITDLAQEVTHSAPMVEADPSPDAPLPDGLSEPVLDPAELAGMATGGYFNVDLPAFVDLALEPGDYEVVVSYGPYRSNPARVQVVRK